MPMSDGIPSSSPGPTSSLEASLKYYKSQYEQLEAELADFQASSKDLEAELERDIEASEKREKKLKDQAAKLKYEVDEWKGKHKQAKGEAGAAQANLEREIKGLRSENFALRQRIRDIEVANDDYERQQRNTEVSLEDLESRYNQTIERAVLLEEEIRTGEQERESLRIEAQRLKDEFSDFKVEAEITKKKLEQAEGELVQRKTPLRIHPAQASLSPRSELSPTTTDASVPSFDTPYTKTASSSGLSDTPTPPSPPTSDRSPRLMKPFVTPSTSKTRLSINASNNIPRQPLTSTRTGHTRGASLASNGRSQPLSTRRQSASWAGLNTTRNAVLPQSSSIIHLRNLRGKMAKLEERVQTARSKLPAPVETPPKPSPRPGSALGNTVPASVTMRNRRRNGGSTVNDGDVASDQSQGTPLGPRVRPSRQSLIQQATSPTRPVMAAPPRPSSRASGVSSRASTSQHLPGHSRPGSRASISGLRTLGGGMGTNFTPNASTERVRPHSSLSANNYDGAFDEEEPETGGVGADLTTPTARRTAHTKRTSDVGSAIPTPSSKRTSIGGTGRLPGTHRRQSTGPIRPASSQSEARPPSRQTASRTRMLDGVAEGYDINETF